MKKKFVPLELSVKLKELGFDEECFYVRVIDSPEYLYTPTNYEDYPEQKEKEVLIPLWQQAFDWFRSEYNIDAWVVPYFLDNTKMYCYIIEGTEYFEDLNNEYDTYEEARLECLKKLIEIVENGRN